MINITLYLTQSLVTDDLLLKDRNVIVVDILRATTTMIVALTNGAKDIIPSETASKAAKIARGSGNSLLCGEREGVIIKGFNLGNSPLEFTPEKITNKSLIFSTTNGTVSIVKSRFAKNCVLGSFVNLSKVVEYIKSLNEDFTILCAGKLNNFCLEDVVCAGLIINRLLSFQPLSLNINSDSYVLKDPEMVAVKLADIYAIDNNSPSSEKIYSMLKTSEHGKYLTSLGFDEDLKICSMLDSYPYLPIYKNSVLKLREKIESEEFQKQQLRMKRIDITGKEQVPKIQPEPDKSGGKQTKESPAE